LTPSAEEEGGGGIRDAERSGRKKGQIESLRVVMDSLVRGRSLRILGEGGEERSDELATIKTLLFHNPHISF